MIKVVAMIPVTDVMGAETFAPDVVAVAFTRAWALVLAGRFRAEFGVDVEVV